MIVSLPLSLSTFCLPFRVPSIGAAHFDAFPLEYEALLLWDDRQYLVHWQPWQPPQPVRTWTRTQPYRSVTFICTRVMIGGCSGALVHVFARNPTWVRTPCAGGPCAGGPCAGGPCAGGWRQCAACRSCTLEGHTLSRLRLTFAASEIRFFVDRRQRFVLVSFHLSTSLVPALYVREGE